MSRPQRRQHDGEAGVVVERSPDLKALLERLLGVPQRDRLA
jgi:hypothetical protein